MSPTLKPVLIPLWIITVCLLIITGIEFYRLSVGNNNNGQTYSNTDKAHFKSMPDLPVTAVFFKKQAHDFGIIPDNQKVYTQFEFTNAGKEPLVIIGAEGSCGCTVPTWPKQSIAPGKTGSIEVAFDPNGKSGEQSKLVTITANTSPRTTVLTVKANIIKPYVIESHHGFDGFGD